MSSHNSSSSSANDPRQPSAAKPYVQPIVLPQDLPVDYAGFIAVVFGVAGVMFRYKLCSWLAVIFCAQSLANMRNIENDLKQVLMASIFALMGLVANYLGPARPSQQTQQKL
ncbi:protein Asterix-like isoform X2 [Manihot esculenta]|uniref:protein Asterix-like isoform X2 n=1 Tax=Manihot esculenta TaxID=3983 RepID=UPI000B5D120F|nr:protein Asterix-like isoform X2 [Manihot esculenta]